MRHPFNQSRLSELSDSALVAECILRGLEDERLYGELFRRHRNGVWRICRRYFSDAEDVEDMTQDIFFKAFRNLDRFDGAYEGSLKAWLGKIAANTCKNELRSRSRRLQTVDEEPDGELVEAPLTTSSELEKAELQFRLEQALCRLSDPQRAILELADLQELPYSEIGLRLGLSPSAVKMRILRARAALALKLKSDN